MTLPWGVTITGGGVAAACCAHRLRMAGMKAHFVARSAPGVPAIMLSDAARALLRDCLDQPLLFADNARIARRIVAWGGQPPVTLAHHAVMLGRNDLAFARRDDDDGGPAPFFTIHAARPAPEMQPRRFGDRTGHTAPARLLIAQDADACWVESVEQGWLFLIPAGEATAWLLGVGQPLETLLDQSRHIRPRMALTGPTTSFDTTPRMLGAMTGPGWIACGSSAMAFDPICGDGTALAARQAILASAILVAMAQGEDAEPLLGHYRAMMVAAMRRHLRLSSQFYESGGDGPWWRAQQAAIADGFAACTARLEREPPPRYALEGFRLVPRDLAA